MYCNVCGGENPDGSKFCVHCGNPVNGVSRGAAPRVLGALGDKLFLAVCILFTCGTGLGFFTARFDVINILLTIFCWLAYSAARKGNADPKNIRSISGTVFASFVIFLVAGGLLILLGIFYSIFLSVISGYGYSVSDLILRALEQIESASSSALRNLLGGYLVFFMNWIHVILIAAAVIYILAAVFAVRPVHRFIKSVYESVQTGTENYFNPHRARVWLMVMGIVKAVTSLPGFSLGGLCIAAALIVSSVLTGKHFDSQQL